MPRRTPNVERPLGCANQPRSQVLPAGPTRHEGDRPGRDRELQWAAIRELETRLLFLATVISGGAARSRSGA